MNTFLLRFRAHSVVVLMFQLIINIHDLNDNELQKTVYIYNETIFKDTNDE